MQVVSRSTSSIFGPMDYYLTKLKTLVMLVGFDSTNNPWKTVVMEFDNGQSSIATPADNGINED